MTAVCLKTKSSLKNETWFNIFSGFNTDSKSCVFIKQLTTTCISTILHLRKVLPDDYFEEKGFEGMTLKLLKSRKGEKYVSKIEQWLEGAFEAMEKKYLKRLMLDIQDPDSNMTLEIYTMSFNYNEENEGLKTLMSGTASCDKGNFSISSTKLNTIRLLQMCYAVTQTYSSLPSQVKLSMRLSYYENTPENYQPNGFVAWEPEEPKFPKQARSIEIGVTSTQYHFFKLFNKSCLSDKFFKDMAKELEENFTLPVAEADTEHLQNVSEERQTKAKRELCFDNPKKSSEANSVVTEKRKEETLFRVSEKCEPVSSKTKNKISKQINVSKEITKTVVTSQNVRCACMSFDRTEKMFSCLGCRFLVHAVCYGILQFDSTKKVRFYCHLCHQKENNFKCHDKVIVSLKNSSDQQISILKRYFCSNRDTQQEDIFSLTPLVVCLERQKLKLSFLRRVLRHCYTPGVDKITLKKIEKLIGSNCPKNLANIVLNKLIEIEVAMPQGKKKSYLIDKKMLALKLPHYFYKVQNSSQSQTLRYSLRAYDNCKRNNFDELPLEKKNKHSAAVKHDFFTSNSQTSQQSCDIFC